MSSAFEAGSAFGGNRMHFPQPGDDGTCGKRINITGNGSDQRCGQSKDGDRHLHYACRVAASPGWRCFHKSWSLEQREQHEIGHQRRIDQEHRRNGG